MGKKFGSTKGHKGHSHAAHRSMEHRFTALLASWIAEKASAPTKPLKEMTEEELKAWKRQRNRRRRSRRRAETVPKGCARKAPAPNRCRRRRLAAKHPERK